MRLVLAVVLCLIAACCASVPNVYERASLSAVTLKWGGDQGVLCSGITTGPHSVITAAHCTEAVGTARLTINDKPTDYSVVANDGNDHVLLRVTQRQGHVTRLVRQNLRVGDVLFVWGNPERVENVMRVGRVAGFGKDTPYCVASLKRAKCDLVLLDAALTHGDSGAPIFNALGQFIGIESGGLTIGAWSLPFFYPIAFTADQLKAARQ